MELDVVFAKEISAWIYSFVTYIETHDKANDSMAKLMHVIQAAKIDGDASTYVGRLPNRYSRTGPLPRVIPI